MSCEQCQQGITASIDHLLEDDTIDYLVEWLQGDGLCAASEDDRCPGAVDAVIRQGLPLMAEYVHHSELNKLCNLAVEGTCHVAPVWVTLVKITNTELTEN